MRNGAHSNPSGRQRIIRIVNVRNSKFCLFLLSKSSRILIDAKSRRELQIPVSIRDKIVQSKYPGIIESRIKNNNDS